MKPNPRLALRREALVELTDADLRAAAGNAPFSAVGPTCDFFDCLKDTLFSNCGHCGTRGFECHGEAR